MKILRNGVVIVFMILSGCGEANTNAPSLNSTQKHPDNWLTGHRAAYSANSIQCRVCHGIDLKGGITKIDCFNQAGLGQCHAGGHGPRLANHLLPFADPTIHGPVARTDLIFCQGCHGTTGGAGSNPRFTVFYGSIPVGCETSGCHLAKTAHPKPWKNHPLAGNQANACSLCHGATFGGGNGPACKNCHAMLVAGQPPISGQCISCHGNPPAGTAIPDIAGSHAAHAALPELGHNCNACHNGGGADSAIHTSFSNHTVARVSFLPAFNAKSGSAAFAINSKSCANVKCHGGQATPAWGATLDSTTECLKCHTAGASQYNGYISGKHNFHLNLGLFCTDCHDMTRQTAPNHFSNLSSAVFNQPAANTIRSYINYNRALQPPTCFITSAPPPGTQFTACHSSLRSWLP